LRWTLGEGKEADTGLAIATAMWWYWWVAGQMSEGRTWLQLALARADAQPSAQRGQALRAAAALARNNGDLTEARRMGAQALAVFEHLGDRGGIISAGNNLAITAQAQRDYDASLAYGFEALRRATDDGLDRAIAMTLNNTAGTLRCMDRLDEAEQMFERALALFQKLSDGRGEAAALTNLAVVARRRGDLVTAQRLTLQFLTLYHTLDIAEGQLDGVEGMACIAAAHGRAAEALPLLVLAARERTRLGAPIFTPDELSARDHAESVARQALTPAQQEAATAAAAQDTLAAAVHRLLTG
jgi:tetratricopeptide (TPR) repeat protein